MKQRVVSQNIDFRGGSGGDPLMLSGYNVESIIASCMKMDAGTTGLLEASNWVLKPYTYHDDILHTDSPSAYYEFGKADIQNGTTAHEGVSGAAITVTNNGIVSGALGAARYTGQYGMLASNAQATDSGLRTFLMAAENAGQNWSFEGIIQRQNATANATLFLESNAGVTVYLQILITTTGAIQISQSGVVKWTSPTTIPVGGTQHIGLTYSAGGGTVQGFLNGVSMGAASAYTRGAGWPGGKSLIGNGGAGQFIVAQVATYQNATLGADDYLRHYNDITTDNYSGGFVSGTATITQNGVGTVVFSNTMTPGFDAGSYTVRMPLSEIMAVFGNNGVFHVQLIITESEIPT